MDSNSPVIKHYLSIRRSLNRYILLGFSILVLLILSATTLGYSSVSKLETSLTTVIRDNNAVTNYIYKLSSIARERSIILSRLISDDDPFLRDEDLLRYRALAADFIVYRIELERLITSPELLTYIKKLKAAAHRSQPLHERAVALIAVDEIERALKIIPDALKGQGAVIDILEAMIKHQQKLNLELENKIEEDIHNDYLIAALSLVFFMIIGAVTGVLAIKMNNKQHDELMHVNKILELSNDTLEETTNSALRANQVKSEFIANMSHELRTPLTSIKGAVGMLNSGMFPNIDPEVMSLVKIADDNSDKLMTLLSDVLDFSKMEAGDIVLTKRDVDIAQEIDRTLLPHRLQADKKNLELILEFDSTVPKMIYTDFEYVSKVVHQLLSNAIKFTEKGRISIGISTTSTNELEISVSDNGPGIQPDELSNIFDLFVQGDGSSTRKHGGTGLGLAICKKIADAMGGEIGADSTLGKGSRFWLKLPLQVDGIAAA